jgi:hypothetical protein
MTEGEFNARSDLGNMAEEAGAHICYSMVEAMRCAPNQATRLRLLCAGLEEVAEECDHRSRAIDGFAVWLIAYLDNGIGVKK